MYKLYALSIVIVLTGILIGCSSGTNPVMPQNAAELPVTVSQNNNSDSNTHLWGFYTVHIDPDKGLVEAVLNRSVQFTANVTNFMNSNPFAMSFSINEILTGPDYIDIDIDVALMHPFPGVPAYDGYDVRGVFMGDGTGVLDSTGVVYPAMGFDQMMLPDPDDGSNRPDGYTRWYNISEFSASPMPLFSYTQGNLATPGFDGSATLCPYMYFADSLGVDETLFSFLDEHADLEGVFSSGATNERGYYLRFPSDEGVVYGYAVIANWEGAEAEFHPSNAPEAVACRVVDTSNVFYVDAGNNGGQLDLEISVFDWSSSLSAGVMEDYDIIIESTVTSGPYQLDDTEMIPVGGNENYSTYEVEITADDVIGTENNEFWVLVQYPGLDYSNSFEMPNLAEDEILTAYFRYAFEVTSGGGNQDPICDLVVVTDLPAIGWDVGTPVEFDASGSSDPDGDVLSFDWDFNGDDVYGDDYDGDEWNPTHQYTESYVGKVYVKVTDGLGGEAICDADVDVTAYQSKNIPLRTGFIPYDLGADPVDGDLLVIYNDGEIWMREADDFYQGDSDQFFGSLADDIMQDPTGLEWLDIAGNSAVSICGVSDNEGFNRQAFYLADGSPGGCGIFIGSNSTLYDAVAFGDDAAEHSNNAGCAKGRNADYNNRYYQELEWHDEPAYCTVHWYSHSIPYGSNTYGPSVIYWPYCVAVEAAKSGAYCWFLEDSDDYYASKWEGIGTGTYSTLAYANEYFGTGSQTEDDDCWWEAQDICRDINEDYFVLDMLSDGNGRVKVFSSGAPGSSYGGFDIPDEETADPLRIEGSDFDHGTFGGYIFVMHGNDVDGYWLSVFLESETPN